MIYLIVTIIGLFTGILSGYLGIGGGLIFVPAFLFIFRAQGYPVGPAMLLATGTSLGAIVLTTFSSTVRHKILGHIRAETLAPIIIGIIISSSVGVMMINEIGGEPLRYFIVLFCLWAAYRMFKHFFAKENKSQNFSHTFDSAHCKTNMGMKLFLLALGLFGGMITSMLGVGAGFPVVASLVILFRYRSAEAVGTASAIAFTAATFGVLFRCLLCESPVQSPIGTIGSLNIPFALFMGIPAMIGAQGGAILHKKIGESKWFYLIFDVFLVIVAARIFF